MKTSSAIDLLRPVALGVGIFAATGAIGVAQSNMNPCPPASGTTGSMYGPSSWSTFDPEYNSVDTWNSAWDTGAYDRNHVLLGTVGSFRTGRLTMTNASGDSMTVDLKEGTVIRPTGATPSSGQRVAVFGYWSNGTFIADRVVLHG